MSWTFEQASGHISKEGIGVLATGYSGAGAGKNNPALQNAKDVGPIPRGTYTIMEPRDSWQHGPYAMPLLASPLNEMAGRDLFWIHGDSVEHPGQASEGCIILPRFARERIWESGDHILQVVAQMEMTA